MKCPRCGVDLSQLEPELTYLKETGLADMGEEQRIQYITQIIQSLAQALEEIARQKQILNQAKLAKQFIGEWAKYAPEIIPALLYTVKPEFRTAYYNLLEKISTVNLNSCEK